MVESSRSSETYSDSDLAVESDIDVLLVGFGLEVIRRYLDQAHWEKESELAHAADAIEQGIKLESVAAHSWHVADAVLLLGPNFSELDVERAATLAVLHDKLELITGDYDPVGRDGQGTHSHAFSATAQAAKVAAERVALEHYLAGLNEPARRRQRALFHEIAEADTPESRFVRAVDKLQALAFVLVRKSGQITDAHLSFSIRYSAKAIEFYPNLRRHYLALVTRLIKAIAAYREVDVDAVIASTSGDSRLILSSLQHG